MTPRYDFEYHYSYYSNRYQLILHLAHFSWYFFSLFFLHILPFAIFIYFLGSRRCEKKKKKTKQSIHFVLRSKYFRCRWAKTKAIVYAIEIDRNLQYSDSYDFLCITHSLRKWFYFHCHFYLNFVQTYFSENSIKSVLLRAASL